MAAAACGSAPSTAWPTACCVCTGRTRSCLKASVMDSDDQLRLVKRVVQALELDDGKYPAKQIAWWINAQKDEGRRPQHIQPEPHDAWLETMRRPTSSTRHAATAPAWSTSPSCCCARMNCCATTRRCCRITAPASARSRWTSSGTPTPSSTPSCACWPAIPATCSWSVTMTEPSTAGAVPRSRTCRASCATSRVRRPSARSRTTAPPPTSSAPPTR